MTLRFAVTYRFRGQIAIDSVEFFDRENDEGVASDFADIVTQMAQDHISILSDLFCAAAESIYDKSKKDQHTIAISSTKTSTAEINTSTSKLEEELKITSRLKKFAFNHLKMATRNCRPDRFLGEWEFGCVFKGWIEENGTAHVKSGTGGASGARNARP
ncbi:hypothetical protein AgCh_022756 [Apium graveolens]